MATFFLLSSLISIICAESDETRGLMERRPATRQHTLKIRSSVEWDHLHTAGHDLGTRPVISGCVLVPYATLVAGLVSVAGNDGGQPGKSGITRYPAGRHTNPLMPR